MPPGSNGVPGTFARSHAARSSAGQCATGRHFDQVALGIVMPVATGTADMDGLSHQLLEQSGVALAGEDRLKLAIEAHRRLDALVAQQSSHGLEPVGIAVEVE